MLSDSLDQAFVTLIVKTFREVGHGFIGRTAIQKLCYFARELGVPINYRFQIYHYGPFSDQLASDLDFMLADQILVDRSRDRSRYSSYELGPQAEASLLKYQRDLKKWDDLVGAIATNLGQLRPEELELVATLHFIFNRLRTAKDTKPEKHEVIAEFTEYKGDKFDSATISEMYARLVRANLLR